MISLGAPYNFMRSLMTTVTPARNAREDRPPRESLNPERPLQTTGQTNGQTAAETDAQSRSERPVLYEGRPTYPAPERPNAALTLSTLEDNIRAYEQAQKNAGGRFAGEITYQYIYGPGGRYYAVAGDAAIDTAPVPGNPRATIAKMETIKAAALFNGSPSAHDRNIAQTALALIDQAEMQLRDQERGRADDAHSQEGLRRSLNRAAAARAEGVYAELTYANYDQNTANRLI